MKSQPAFSVEELVEIAVEMEKSGATYYSKVAQTRRR